MAPSPFPFSYKYFKFHSLRIPSSYTMEVHSRAKSLVAKKIWNILRITFYMLRKGLVSKRKLIMDMNLMMKKGKVVRKSLRNLMFHQSKNVLHGSEGVRVGLHHYEFSCSNSPNPAVSFHMSKGKSHNFFPCINPPDVDEETMAIAGADLPKIECSPGYSTHSFRFSTPDDLAPGEKLSPLLRSPFSVRVSNYSSVEEENDDISSSSKQVDGDAEEFIRRFYEQLRVQSHTQLLQYQEMQYQEMLARGT